MTSIFLMKMNTVSIPIGRLTTIVFDNNKNDEQLFQFLIGRLTTLIRLNANILKTFQFL